MSRTSVVTVHCDAGTLHGDKGPCFEQVTLPSKRSLPEMGWTSLGGIGEFCPAHPKIRMMGHVWSGDYGPLVAAKRAENERFRNAGRTGFTQRGSEAGCYS